MIVQRDKGVKRPTNHHTHKPFSILTLGLLGRAPISTAPTVKCTRKPKHDQDRHSGTQQKAQQQHSTHNKENSDIYNRQENE